MSAHQVVEASAGTGKTYWIEHEVIRLIETGVSLSGMLLVTFTEKATAELQARIRKRIAKSLLASASDPVRHLRFLQAERDLDTASIFTIHGFCNQTLGDFAFEMREHLSATLVNDGELRKMLLPVLIREWPARFGANLPDLLYLSGFPNVNRGDNSNIWENNVISLASRIGPRDRILPANPVEPTAENIQKISSLMETCAAQLGELRPDPRSEPMIQLFKTRTGANLQSRKIKFLTAFVREVKAESDDSMFRRSVRFCLPFLKDGLDIEIPGDGKLENWTRQLQQVYDLLCSMQYYLTVVTVSELKEKIQSHKLSKNLRSYDDMLTQLHHAVMQHESLRQKLREKYKVAIVDEFQDTDSIQWEIFQKLFLESQTNSLIIVGDPKQA
ncbi:MAG: UvrD-helicase domain-containing protein, partial [Leptospirales bacterium]|nr:UvrD-helicase domain-containing protein [Leptospirales bacterium]